MSLLVKMQKDLFQYCFCLFLFERQTSKNDACLVQQTTKSPPSGLLWFLKLHRLQQTLKTEVVGVAVDWDLVGTRAHHFWFQRRKRVCPASLHVHLQLQQDLQGVGHLRLTVYEGQDASQALT